MCAAIARIIRQYSLCESRGRVANRECSKPKAARAMLLAVFCLLFVTQPAGAAAPLMAIRGVYGVTGAAAPGDNGFSPDGLPQAQNTTSSGAFTYTIPIMALPGSHGMVPHVALTYSSGNGDGHEGIGWTISGLSQITRCPQTIAEDGYTGSVNFNAQDRFCLDGQRLILTSGSYGADGSQYHTEIESFRKIVAKGAAGSGPAYFDVWTKDGMHYQYGNGNNSAMIAPDNATVRIWALDQVTDPNGNYISYAWNNWSSYFDYAIQEIDYTGNTKGNGTYNSIKFAYDTTRTDVTPMFQAGAKIWSTNLLSSITVNHGSTAVWTYTPSYNAVESASWYPSGAGNVWHNQLATLQLSDVHGNPLPTMKFTWQGGPATWSMSSGTARSFSVYKSLMPGDFNGDGLTDILAYDTSSAGDIYLSDANGNFVNNTVEQAMYDYWPVKQVNPDQYDGASWFSYAGHSPCCLAATPSILDMDGDGFSDILLPVTAWFDNEVWTNPEIFEVLRNNQSGMLGQLTTSNTFFYNSQIVGDFDGDGRDDVFNWCESPTCPIGYSTYAEPQLSDGTGNFANNQNLMISLPTDAGVSVGDFDGSGCSGLFQQNATQSEPGEIYDFCDLPNGAQGVVSMQIPNWSFSGSSAKVVLGDFNGDGKTDILVANSNGATLYLSSGKDLRLYQVCTSGCAVGGSSWHNYTIVVGDFNGDGKADVALISNTSSTAHAIYLSTGTDFVAGPTISNSNGCNSATVADWNSDGASDLWLQGCSGNDTEYTFAYTPELLQQVDDGNGKVTTVSYDRINKGGSLYTNGSGATWPTQYVNGPIYVVSGIATSDGIGGTRSWSYNYQGLEKNVAGLGFKGFDDVTVTDNQTNIVKTVEYYSGWPLYGYPKNLTVTWCCNTGQSKVTLANIAYAYYFQNLGGYYFTLPYTTSYQGNDLDGSPWPSTQTTFAYDNCTYNNSGGNCGSSYGNLAQKTYANQLDGFTSLVSNTYNPDTADWVLDLPASSSTTNTPSSGPVITRTMSFTEGSGGVGQEPWQIVGAVVEPGANDTTNLNISYGYDSWGNLTSTGFSGSQIVPRSSSMTYDGNGEFPVTTTNALSQSETLSLAAYPNQPNTVVDLNGLTTTWKTDTFGRPSNTTKPDGTQVNVSYYYCNSTPSPPYSCAQNAVFLAATTYTGPGGAQNAPTTVVHFDSLGRVLATDTQSFDGSTFSRVSIVYDNLGNVSRTSRPWFITKNPILTKYTYDALGRVTDIVFPDANQTENKYAYHALTTTASLDVNDLNETTTTVRNPEGLVASVTDSNNGVTSYAYDAFGDLLTVTSPDQTQVINVFDTLGRKVKSVDPDMGTWKYGYDNLGELYTQQSPLESANNLTTLYYDNLGRLISRTEPDMTASWCYDGLSQQNQNSSCPASFAVGSLVQASCSGTACAGAGGSQTYTRTYAYDSLSRPLSVTIQYGNGPSYTSSEAYDNTGTGLISQVTGFSGFQTTNLYNPQGYLYSVTSGGSGNIPAVTQWIADTVDASGHLTEETAGNGIVTQRSYDPFMGRLTAITAGNDSDKDNVADLSYTWDDIGNLTSRSDNIETYTENFCYDALNRLTSYALFDGGGSSACSGGTINKSVGYDAEFPNGIGDGNITSKSDLGVYAYGQFGAGPHAVTSINTTGPSNGGCTLSRCLYDGISNPNLLYDADGNIHCVTTRTSCNSGAARTYAFTSFDMVETIQQGTGTTSIGYSPEHQRGELTTPSGTLYYFSNPVAGVMEELAPGGTQWNTYLVPYGHLVAEMFTAGGTTTPYYFTGDHLTSTTALTDQNGNQTEADSYDAWGNRRLPSGVDKATGCNQNPSPPSKTTRGFTSQEELDKLCLVNLNARLYDPALGRMMSADPTVPEATNGQAFNRYAYTVNRPLSLVDPSGYSWIDFFKHLLPNDGSDSSDGDDDDDSSSSGSSSGSNNGLGDFGGVSNCYIGDMCGGSRIPGGNSSPIYGAEGLMFLGAMGAWNDAGMGGLPEFVPNLGAILAAEQPVETTNLSAPSQVMNLPPEGVVPTFYGTFSISWMSFMEWNGVPGGGYINDPPIQTADGLFINTALLAAAVESFFAREALAQTTTLFRAVQPAELQSIQDTGMFSNVAGLEGKYFSTTLDGAQAYADAADAAFGDGPYTIVQTTIPSSMMPDMVTVEFGVPTVFVPSEILTSLSEPVIVH